MQETRVQFPGWKDSLEKERRMQACLDRTAVSQLCLVIAKRECGLHGTAFVFCDFFFFFLRKAKTWVLRAQSVKYSPANAGNLGLTPRTGRCPGEENGNPWQFSCLGNPMDRGAWQATNSSMAKQLDTT